MSQRTISTVEFTCDDCKVVKVTVLESVDRNRPPGWTGRRATLGRPPYFWYQDICPSCSKASRSA